MRRPSLGTLRNAEDVIKARKDLRDSYKPSEGLEVKLVPLRGGARSSKARFVVDLVTN